MNVLEAYRKRLAEVPDPPMALRSLQRTYKDDPLWVGPEYTGPRVHEGSRGEVAAMLTHFLSGEKHTTLHYRYFVQTLLAGCDTMRELSNVVDINVPPGGRITVVGDLHGQFYDLAAIIGRRGLPSPVNYYLFNGDFVDRGAYSTEVLVTVYALRALYPRFVYLNRGNHETLLQNKAYGFARELTEKNGYPPDVLAFVAEAYRCLPLAHIIGGRIFVVHAGLAVGADNVPESVASINKIKRHCEVPDGGSAMCGLLWSDLQEKPGTSPSRRGTNALSFGPDVTQKFLEENGLKLLVRSHEVQAKGVTTQQGGLSLTVFSAPNYVKGDNLGGIVGFESPNFEPVAYRFASYKVAEASAVMAKAAATLGVIERDKMAKDWNNSKENECTDSDDNDDVYFNQFADMALEENDDVVFNSELVPPKCKKERKRLIKKSE